MLALTLALLWIGIGLKLIADLYRWVMEEPPAVTARLRYWRRFWTVGSIRRVL